MNDTKIPESTPFSVYCQARAIVTMGQEYPTSMCNNDPRLLFAAMVGIEDGLRVRYEVERGEIPRAFRTETAVLRKLDKAFPRHESVPEALGLDGAWSVMLTWDDGDDDDSKEQHRIADVIIGGRFRPTRATWQKLIDAGLPMCSWQEASEGWDLEAAK